MTHQFDTDIAEKHGVNCAIIYQNIKFWCEKNKANDKNFYDSNYWTYNSVKAWRELFPYLGESQIKTALKKLESVGLIASGEHNQNKYDRTKWYSIVELEVLANGDIESSQPIPDNKQDNKTNNKSLLKIPKSFNGFNYPDSFENLWKLYNEGTKSTAYKAYVKIATVIDNQVRLKPEFVEPLKAILNKENNKTEFKRHLSTILNLDILAEYDKIKVCESEWRY